MAVAAGAAKHVLVYRALNARSGRRFGAARDPRSTPSVGTGWGLANWTAPYGALTPAAILSMHTLPYMRTFGVTNEDFGRYVVGIRDFAATNSDSWFYEQPVTLADHQASRWIIEPILRLLDCCQETDGGVAFVVTSTDRACDLPQPAAIVVGATQHAGRADRSADALYAMAGLQPADIDVAMIYDAFSPHVFHVLEDLGFCKPGEAKDFVASGAIARGGALPVNTNGGLIGEAYIHGMNLITEAVRQIRGTAVNQVNNVNHALMSSGGGAFILSRDS
jgi:acetyl-CoA acetyltransferase